MIFNTTGVEVSAFRNKLIEYSRTLPTVSSMYTVGYYQGHVYFNIKVDQIRIRAVNDADACVKWLDYLNAHLDAPATFDQYALDDDVSEFVDGYFDNDTLWLKRQDQEIFIE